VTRLDTRVVNGSIAQVKTDVGSDRNHADLMPMVRRRRATRARHRRGTKSILVLPICYVASPIQLIPSFIPVLGQLDDVLVVVVCLRVAARRVPPDLLHELWPGEPAALDRLLHPGLHRRPTRHEMSDRGVGRPSP